MSFKTYILSLLFCYFCARASAQNTYWQQNAHVRIQAELNDRLHTINGKMDLNYVNFSPDTLHTIWFHLWPNAFRTDQTAFSDQMLENGRLDFYFSEQQERGYINRLDFRVNGRKAETNDHAQHIDIQELILPEPLAPGDSCLISTSFHVQLPKNFSRGGHYKKTYQVSQWYPKPAVYDKTGWHPYPYLEQGEFYSEFGNYDVTITAPDRYKILSTGVLKQITKNQLSTSDSIQKTSWNFQQDNVHDFAWFADDSLTILNDTLQLPSGKIIQLTSGYHKKNEQIWKNSIRMMKQALLFRSSTIGEYPYPNCSVVETYMGFEGGMEYPCITSITTPAREVELESLIEHEIGHNWFQGILASDERRFAWLDEGVNSYYDRRYAALYQKEDETGRNFTQSIEEAFLTTLERTGKDQPLSTSSEQLSRFNYFMISYRKGAAFMQQLEEVLGKETFDKGMKLYFERWKFKHPYPEDLQQALEESSGKVLDSLFSRLNQKGPLKSDTQRKTVFAFPFKLNTTTRNVISLTPAIGYNLYDGTMLGAMLSNYNLPPTRFQFLVLPLYGTKSRTMNGAARISYNSYPRRGLIERIQVSTAWMKFTKSDFTDSAGRVYRTGFSKFTPSIKLNLRENPRSTRERFLQWKTFLIQENNLKFRRDTFANGNTFTNISTTGSFRYLNQLRYVVKNTRVLYPYQAEWMAEQAKDFVRLAFTAQYRLNFNEKKAADVRFFAGKFFYLGTPTIQTRFRNDRFHLNLSGPNGNEDYTYSHYYIGRSEFDGWTAQQIALRDGAFKVRTDLLANKVGKTDNWLASFNLVSDIPDQINLLNILPVKIPLKVYLDIGTYAEAWSPKAEGSKLLYNAGLQLALLNNRIQLYMPLFYSRVYRDYFQSVFPDKRFLRAMSFIINLQDLNLKTIDQQLPF